MTMSNKTAQVTLPDPAKDQVAETRRVLEEMWGKADNAIDAQRQRGSTPAAPKK